MDLLDTFGDWMELFGAILLLWPIAIAGAIFTRLTGLPGLIATAIIAYIFWVMVYDYDLVLGYLIGGCLWPVVEVQPFVGFARGVDYQGQGRMQEATITGVRVIIYLCVAVVMITKMVLFW